MQLRITKYNPLFRNECGHFIGDDWTAISDIGKYFSGNRLLASDYFVAENAYCDTIKILLQNLCINSMEVTHCGKISKGDFPSFFTDTTHYSIGRNYCRKLSVGKKCFWGDLDILIRACLREYCDCAFAGRNGTYLHFGYDYYMFFGSNENIQINTIDFPQNIYIEENFPSPMLDLEFLFRIPLSFRLLNLLKSKFFRKKTNNKNQTLNGVRYIPRPRVRK